MEENKVIETVEVEAVEGDVVTVEKSGMSTGLAMLVGAGLTLATIAGVKIAKKAYAKRKKVKELEAEQDFEDEDDFEEDECE